MFTNVELINTYPNSKCKLTLFYVRINIGIKSPRTLNVQLQTKQNVIKWDIYGNKPWQRKPTAQYVSLKFVRNAMNCQPIWSAFYLLQMALDSWCNLLNDSGVDEIGRFCASRICNWILLFIAWKQVPIWSSVRHTYKQKNVAITSGLSCL